MFTDYLPVTTSYKHYKSKLITTKTMLPKCPTNIFPIVPHNFITFLPDNWEDTEHLQQYKVMNI